MNMRILKDIPDYHNQITPKINAEPNRAYYIPFSDERDCLGGREHSTQCRFLSDWQVEFFEDIADVRGESLAVKTPSLLQDYGLLPHQYLNDKYPFPFTPPTILGANACAVYTTVFSVYDLEKAHYLVTEGVDSGYHLYLNGKWIGYSSVSHNVTEFLLNDGLLEGENTLQLLLLQRCTGSYFECQDKFRTAGIFRDVYLLSRPKGHIRDYKITSDFCDGRGIFRFEGDQSAKLTLCDGERVLASKEGGMVEFTLENVRPWSCEAPYLYTLIVECNGEFIGEYIGFRRVEVANKRILLNGKPFKFKGVNRHSSFLGRPIESVAQMEEDIRLMKAHNINAVRTAHYPPHPLFPSLCDKLGILLMVEADIETHGTQSYTGWYSNDTWNYFAEREEYYPQFAERILGAYERDKNRPSVLCWSLGNESGWGVNFKRAAEELRALDSRPIHYEGSANYKTDTFRDEGALSMFSRMYPSIELMEKIMASEDYDRPFVLCEYSHAMGNSCGDLQAYWQKMYADDSLIGGFVWEWCDHAVEREGKLCYGGDFGENFHNGNFCCDGLISADRKRVHSSLKELKAVYAPVTVIYREGEIQLTSRAFFENLQGRVQVTLKADGRVCKQEEIPFCLAPSETMKIPFELTEGGKAYTALYFSVREKSGAEVYTGFHELQKSAPALLPALLAEGYEEDGFLRLRRGEREISVEKRTGEILLKRGGKSLFASPMRYCIGRASIDNDVRDDRLRKERGIERAFAYVRKIACADGKIEVLGGVYADGTMPFMEYEGTYYFTEEGVGISLRYTIPEDKNNLARVGLYFALDNCSQVAYLGYGEEESYVDKKAGCVKDYFVFAPKEQACPYVKPQEYGGHVDSDWVDFGEFAVEGNRGFSFSALPYSLQSLSQAKHDFELKKDGKTYVHLDAQMCGVGSNACGPALAEEFRLKLQDEIVWQIKFKE